MGQLSEVARVLINDIACPFYLSFEYISLSYFLVLLDSLGFEVNQ